MTPEQARKLHDNTSPAPGEIDTQTHQEADCPEVTESVFNLIAAAPDMAAMIANMTAEYAVQGKAPSSDEWITLSQWSEELPPSEFEFEITLTDEDTGETHRIDARIAARYVTAPQPLGEEQ